MPARNTAGGTVLAGTMVVDATISHGATAYSGEAAFIGAGGFAESATLFMRASAAWAGAGNFAESATLFMRASANLAGVGGFAVDATTSKQPIFAAATFAGAGSLVANAIQFSAGIYDETGAATLSVSANAITELEFGLKLDYDNLVTGDVLSFRVYLDGQPLTTYSVTPSITVAAHAIRATAAFAGIGSLTVDSSVVRGALEGAALLTGTGNFVIAPVLRMLAQGTFVGAGLMVVDLAKLAQVWQGEAAFAGVGNLAAIGASIRINVGRPPGEISDIFQGAGNFSATAKLLAQAQATFAGVGSMSATPQEWMAARASFYGVGSLTVNLLQLGKIFETATFFGVGSLVANTRQWMQAAAAFTGQGNASITPRLIMRTATTRYAGTGAIDIGSALRITTRATFSGIGNQSALAFLLCNASAKYAGVGNMATTPRLLMDSGEVDFNGVGLMAVTARQRMMVTGAFGGEGNFDITPRLRMRASASYYGEGSMYVDLTPPVMAWSGQAVFVGEGTLSALGTFDLATAASMEAAGNLSVDAIRFINLSEQFFTGTGSLIADSRQVLGAFARYGGEGNMTIATMMTSAREYWLICSGIAMQPEILGDATMAAAVAGSFDLTTPLDGKPAVREC